MATPDRSSNGEGNKLRSNSFQTPNVLIDRLMPLLLNDELRVVMFANSAHLWMVRELATRSAPLSLTAFEHGHRGSAGCGLKRPAIHAAIRELWRPSASCGGSARPPPRVSAGRWQSATPTSTGMRWRQRQVEIADANRRRTAKAVRTSAQQRSPGTSTYHWYVPHTREMVCPTYQPAGMSHIPVVCPTYHLLVCPTYRQLVCPTYPLKHSI